MFPAAIRIQRSEGGKFEASTPPGLLMEGDEGRDSADSPAWPTA